MWISFLTRASIVVAAHNEGERLVRTVGSCIQTTRALDCEIIIADDASDDGSVKETKLRFPRVRVLTNRERRGGPATKARGGRAARGRVIVFLDGHCKPEGWSIVRLVNDVESLGGKALVTPAVPALDCEHWVNKPNQIGHGYRMELADLDCRWIGLRKMRSWGRFFESPALQGCAFAIARKLYRKLLGFDGDMLEWGVEDLDLGLKAWLTGHPILHDPDAVIGHRFQRNFENFSVSTAAVVSNQIRMARKNFAQEIWTEWLEGFRSRHPPQLWEEAWNRFTTGQKSVERERRYILSRRVWDERWYAERFGLRWPRRNRSAG